MMGETKKNNNNNNNNNNNRDLYYRGCEQKKIKNKIKINQNNNNNNNNNNNKFDNLYSAVDMENVRKQERLANSQALCI